MASSIVEYWRRCSGVVHPDDKPLLDDLPNDFKLKGPPAPYIGDVDRSAVVLLFANAGYREGITDAEFVTDESVARFMAKLHSSAAYNPLEFGDYWQEPIASLVSSGRLSIVNACAYRSVSIAEEPRNQRVCDFLPSVHTHRKWLVTELAPQSRAGLRLVIVHRWKLWRLDPSDEKNNFGPNFLFGSSPVAKSPSRKMMKKVEAWLARHR
jgi:hypothetical protein